MPTNFAPQADALASIIVRAGLNLQPEQGLLVAEPYELQGVSRSAAALVDSVKSQCRSAGAGETECIWGDEARLRRMAEDEDFRSFEQLVADNARRLSRSIARGDALLFLESVHPRIMHGLPASTTSRFRTIALRHFAPVAQRLIRGETNWTVVPAPTLDWADIVYPDLLAGARLGALWTDVLAACRFDGPDSVSGWSRHLADLRGQADNLNRRRLSGLRFLGPGTDLRVALPSQHVWRTANLVTTSGLPFVANLPTEEIFSLPHSNSAEGGVRVARPISYGGGIIDGIEMEFRGGRVVNASARTGAEQLRCLLETDDGASRLGEVAWVPQATAIGRRGRFFCHPLLDENALPHIALGNAYPFTLLDGITWTHRALKAAGANQSLIHVDLPVEVSEVIWRA